jgi:hypothetical protein
VSAVVDLEMDEEEPKMKKKLNIDKMLLMLDKPDKIDRSELINLSKCVCSVLLRAPVNPKKFIKCTECKL